MKRVETRPGKPREVRNLAGTSISPNSPQMFYSGHTKNMDGHEKDIHVPCPAYVLIRTRVGLVRKDVKCFDGHKTRHKET